VSVDTLGGQQGIARRQSGVDLRLSAAIAVGKLAALASRRLGIGGGTTLPGLLATRVEPRALHKLASQLPRGTTIVTGTNGKTTTSRLLVSMLQSAGWRPVHNRTGSNLPGGLATALVDGGDLKGRPRGDSALFETDEAVMPRILADVRPRVVVLTNLFRDQLDRYGEVDYVAGIWREAVRVLSPEATLVLNADDPGVAALGQIARARVRYFGLSAPPLEHSTSGHLADSRHCPVCGSPLRYDVVRYAHIGSYACPAGDFVRPPLDVAARAVVLRGVEASELEVIGPFGAHRWRFNLPGLYNVYNLLAAVTAALALDVPTDAIERGMSEFSAAFGRLERITVGDRMLLFALIKNPIGLSEVLRMILGEPGSKHLVIVINDNLADGTDVSWLWDAEVEQLADRCERVIVSGTRAGDMAVRLKYAGVPPDRILPMASLERALDVGIEGLPPGGTLYILPTYTALLDLRKLVGRRGYASHYWDT
jgi:UDP-N-acetylmuramyl tripeptide synthase